jgi:hypothetical protein
VRSLALLFFVLLVACGSTKLHVEESPTRRLGGSFDVPDVSVSPNVSASNAEEDAALLARELRGALAYLAQDGAGDDKFVLHASLVEYSEMMVVVVDIFDRQNRRLARFDVSCPGSARGWTGAARENARYEIVQKIASYLRSNR